MDRGIPITFAKNFSTANTGVTTITNYGGNTMPEYLTCMHEESAVAMAHGVYLMNGRPQAVMVHVNVGTANAVAGIMNAWRGNIPVLDTQYGNVWSDIPKKLFNQLSPRFGETFAVTV